MSHDTYLATPWDPNRVTTVDLKGYNNAPCLVPHNHYKRDTSTYNRLQLRVLWLYMQSTVGRSLLQNAAGIIKWQLLQYPNFVS